MGRVRVSVRAGGRGGSMVGCVAGEVVALVSGLGYS